MSIESVDKSGELPSDTDVDEAITVVTKFIVNMKFMMQIPELAVQLPNIRRCLAVAKMTLPELRKARGESVRVAPEGIATPAQSADCACDHCATVDQMLWSAPDWQAHTDKCYHCTSVVLLRDLIPRR